MTRPYLSIVIFDIKKEVNDPYASIWRPLCYIIKQHPRLRLLHVHIQALLDDKEGRVSPERLTRMDEPELVIAQQSRDDLVDLEQREIAADADVCAAAELLRPSVLSNEDQRWDW